MTLLPEGVAMALVLALLLDALFGEPKWLWDRLPHPAVLMGRAVGWCDARFNGGTSPRLTGVLVVIGLSIGAIALGRLIAGLPFGWLWSVIGAAILLAQRSLVDHVRAVANGLETSLAEGRAAVSMIVGRDTADMAEADIARAAIESAAENFSDGIVAPALWFLIAGLPGILFYKIINTADSMIGHRTPRHEAFGWAAARLDDVLNWGPARISAVLIALGNRNGQALAVARRDARHHRSPNAGWPEAAMAAVLGLQLSGPRAYGGVMTDDAPLNPAGRRAATARDIAGAIHALWRSWMVLVGAAALVALLL